VCLKQVGVCVSCPSGKQTMHSPCVPSLDCVANAPVSAPRTALTSSSGVDIGIPRMATRLLVVVVVSDAPSPPRMATRLLVVVVVSDAPSPPPPPPPPPPLLLLLLPPPLRPPPPPPPPLLLLLPPWPPPLLPPLPLLLPLPPPLEPLAVPPPLVLAVVLLPNTSAPKFQSYNVSAGAMSAPSSSHARRDADVPALTSEDSQGGTTV
jgi:hypothetical protein